MMGFALFMAFPSSGVLALLGLFALLLLFYIRHYYLLENGTQRLYGLMDRMKKMSLSL